MTWALGYLTRAHWLAHRQRLFLKAISLPVFWFRVSLRCRLGTKASHLQYKTFVSNPSSRGLQFPNSIRRHAWRFVCDHSLPVVMLIYPPGADHKQFKLSSDSWTGQRIRGRHIHLFSRLSWSKASRNIRLPPWVSYWVSHCLSSFWLPEISGSTLRFRLSIIHQSPRQLNLAFTPNHPIRRSPNASPYTTQNLLQSVGSQS